MVDDRRIEALERRVARLEKQLAQAAQPRWIPVDDATAAATTTAATSAVAATRAQAAAPQPGVPAPPTATPRRSLESVLGANWLARAGVLLLGLGVVFFLRLAYDRGWVPIEGRYAIGLAGGLALWVAGDLLRGRRLDPAFAQVVAGGGAVILYVTVYLGYALAGYRDALGMSLPLVLALLGLVSLALGAYAVWRNLPILGGAAAGLATILLAPAGDLSTAGVLYAVLLDTALLLASVARRWDSVALTAIVAANVPILVGFAAEADIAWQLLLACAAVANGAGIAAAAAARHGARTLVSIQGGLALAFLAAATAAALSDAGVARPVGWALLAVGAAGLVVAFALPRPGPGIGAAAAALLLLWPLAHFEDSLWTPLTLGALAVCATALGLARPRTQTGTDVAALAGAVLGLLAYYALAHAEGLADGHRLLAGGAGLVVTSAGLLAWSAARGRQAAVAWMSLVVGLLALLATLAAVLESWLVTVSWAVVAVAAVVLGLSPRAGELRLAAFGLFGLVILRIFAVDLAGLGVVARVVAFMATGALLLVAAFFYARGRRAPPA